VSRDRRVQKALLVSQARGALQVFKVEQVKEDHKVQEATLVILEMMAKKDQSVKWDLQALLPTSVLDREHQAQKENKVLMDQKEKKVR